MESYLNILVVDDYLVVRKGIELIINESYPNANVYFAENYTEAIEIIKIVAIDLVVLDVIINGFEDIKIMENIRKHKKDIKILVFSCHEEELYGARYIKNGADGFLNKDCSEATLVEAIHSTLKTGSYYSSNVKEKLKKIKVNKTKSNPIDRLSNREFEVAKMLIEGSGNLEIANRLNIQMSTVSTYKIRIFEKLDVNNIVALSKLFKVDVN
ncbi:response regulator transcription factor [Flavobacterium sp.]|uniref:response regulator n=1 Tax=Flavobacterium sp. TaxID=239 RepID=UPI0026251759|nr:response regulator transcription factor [Flavobacterium sp.]